MTHSIIEFIPVLPEIYVLVMACIALLAGLFAKKDISITYFIVQWTLLTTTLLTIMLFPASQFFSFNQMFVSDQTASILKIFIYLTSFFAFVYARRYVKEFNIAANEFYVLGLFSILGMMILVSAYDFIVLFLGLELFSLPIYAMVALNRDSSICTEAAIKYFVIGSLASGILLYGMSMIYGLTGSLNIAEIVSAIGPLLNQQPLLLSFGLVFMVVGMVFKLGAVPFHMWVPDVYEGAPNAVVLFLGTASKIAALGLLYRILTEALPNLHVNWQQLLILTAIASMALGNIAAIAQKNLKRMLAYSSIAHMGYMLLGFIAGTGNGYGAALFYIVTYAIMTLGAFGLLTMLSKNGQEVQMIDDLRGLNSRNPWLALMMLLVMFSLAGVPPIVGFMAKVAVFESVIKVGLIWLAAIAVAFSVVGAYYYIRVVKVMYFEKPKDTEPFVCTSGEKIVFSINGLLVLLLGIFPGFLFQLCLNAF